MNNVILYIDNSDFTSYKESYMFTTVDDATRYFITEVKEN